MLLKELGHPAEFLINKLNFFGHAFHICVSHISTFENYTLTDIKVQKKNNIK